MYSGKHSASLDPVDGSPVRDAFCLSVDCDQVGSSLVFSLLRGRCPSAVSRLIMAVRINSIDSSAIRARSKIKPKIREILISKLYSLRSIPFVTDVLRVFAPGFCTAKGHIFRKVFTSSSQAPAIQHGERASHGLLYQRHAFDGLSTAPTPANHGNRTLDSGPRLSDNREIACCSSNEGVVFSFAHSSI